MASALAVKRSHSEEIRRTAGENEFTVYRTHLQLELSPAVRQRIEPIWRQQVSLGRSVDVAGLLALVTALAGVVAGYFRLDERTGGRRRWLLRFGALAATALVGLTVSAGTTVASHAVKGHYSPLAPPTRVPVELVPPSGPAPGPIPDPHRLIHVSAPSECGG
jgi:hypothetical protein